MGVAADIGRGPRSVKLIISPVRGPAKLVEAFALGLGCQAHWAFAPRACVAKASLRNGSGDIGPDCRMRIGDRLPCTADEEISGNRVQLPDCGRS
jgi:hypothetical protein